MGTAAESSALALDAVNGVDDRLFCDFNGLIKTDKRRVLIGCIEAFGVDWAGGFSVFNGIGESDGLTGDIGYKKLRKS